MRSQDESPDDGEFPPIQGALVGGYWGQEKSPLSECIERLNPQPITACDE